MTDELDRGALGALQYLAQGGQGKVYLAPHLTLPDTQSGLVFKEYKKGQVSPLGLRAIVAVRSRLDPAERDRLDSMAAWPARVVRDGSDIVGVVMPLIPETFFQQRRLPSGKVSRDPLEIQHLFVGTDRCVALGMPNVDLPTRFAICRDLAGALAFLHKNDVVFGDVNAKNALFRPTTTSTVMLVDCDAVRISGSAAVVKQLNAPDWEPPEGKVLSRRTDVYKFGLFVLRALVPGPFASTSRDPERVARILDPEGRRLLAATLAADPKARPPADDWRVYFAKRTSAVSKPVGPSTPAAPRTPHPGWRKDPATGKWVLAK